MPHKQNKSFTLIEMLIVVVIIGILAAALIPRLQSVQARARDTKRKADLHQIATALEIYKEDNGSFNEFERNHNAFNDIRIITDSKHTQFYNDIDTQFMWGMEVLAKYMTSIPTDPQPDSSWGGGDIGQSPDLIYGYELAILPKYIDADNGQNHLTSFLLGARTESAGNSSNWVSNNQLIVDNSNDGNAYYITGSSTNTRIGALGGWNAGGDKFAAQVYLDYICKTVTLSGATDNDGQGTCNANKDGNDLRYIYVN